MSATLANEDIEAIATAVCERMEHKCQCNLSPEAQKEMSHFWGMLKDESDGDPGRGVESLRRVIQSDKRARKWGDVVAKAIIVVLATTFITAVIAGIVTALKKTFGS